MAAFDADQAQVCAVLSHPQIGPEGFIPEVFICTGHDHGAVAPILADEVTLTVATAGAQLKKHYEESQSMHDVNPFRLHDSANHPTEKAPKVFMIDGNVQFPYQR